MIVYDTETCGFHGMCVLIQYKHDNSNIQLYEVWRNSIKDTLNLIQYFMSEDLVGFNLAFDHFHLCKLYTVLSLVPDKSIKPEEIVDEIAELEAYGRNGLCLKPRRSCDVMLHCRKGKYQNTMRRKDIRIKKVPLVAVSEVRDYLEEKIKLDDIYFANRKNKYAPRWAIFDSDEGPEWKDIVLKFRPGGALKILAEHVLGYNVIKYGDLQEPEKPFEVGYAPFATAISNKNNSWWVGKKKTWPGVIDEHIGFWAFNRKARQYALDDVTYTYELWKHLGSPEPGDDDSELACMVGANRWRGYAINKPKLDELEIKVVKDIKAAPRAPNSVKAWLTASMSDEEKNIFEIVSEGSTKKVVLESLADNWEGEVADKAKAVLLSRQSKYKLDLIRKLKTANRFHASAEIIGTLSGRKSGRGGDLNSQGIGREYSIRECFPLALNDMVLCGGDFEAYEVTLAIAAYSDDKLEEAVKSGKKVYTVFGTYAFPHMTYEQIAADKDIYNRSKSGFLAMIYGGEAYTLKTRLNVDEESAQQTYNNFIKAFPKTGEGRQKIFDMFCAVKQPKGIGTAVEWHEPKDCIETMLGFPRYFTLENKICKALFKLAQSPPKEWKDYTGVIIRRDREQTISGSIQSALYASAFALQSSNMRAAGNHIIQGTGAQICKNLERKLWDIQPTGIHKWQVQPLNEHDEVMCPCVPDKINEVKETVKEVIKSFKDRVPLLSIDWHNNMESWAEK
jgi:hypothetical protein